MSKGGVLLSEQHNARSGVWLILAATICWSTSGLFIRLIPADALLVNALRSLIALPLFLTCSKKVRAVTPKWNRVILLSALCVCLTNNLFFISLSWISVGTAVVLQYTAPIFVLLMTCLRERRTPHPAQLGVVALGVSGVAIVFSGDLVMGADPSALLGGALALASGLTFAGVFFVNRLPGASPLDSTMIAFTLNLIPGLFFLREIPGIGGGGWLALAGLGLIQHGLAYILFSRGIGRCPSFGASLIGMLEVLLVPVWAYFSAGEAITGAMILGGGMVLSAVLFNALYERKKST